MVASASQLDNLSKFRAALTNSAHVEAVLAAYLDKPPLLILRQDVTLR